jgi:hypothetical protein
LEKRKTLWILFASLLVGALARLWVAAIYQPVDYPDSQGYWQMARVISSAQWMDNLGARPPVYPAFLVLSDGNYAAIGFWQAMLGIVTVALFVFASWRAQDPPWLTVLAGLLPTLYLPLLFLEQVVLAEAFSHALVVAWFFAIGILTAAQPDKKMAFTAGLLAGFATLTKPFFVFLGILGVILLFARLRRVDKTALHLAAWAFVPFLILTIGWSWFNARTTGVFGVSAISGFNIINHTGKFIEYAPDEYAHIRDIYLVHRAARIEARGTDAMTIWSAYPEIDPSGAHYHRVSQELVSLSIWLITHYPEKYLFSVADAWVSFWKAPIYWQAQAISPDWAKAALDVFWRVERIFLLAFNALFLLVCVYFVWRLFVRRAFTDNELNLALLTGVVLTGSVLQALADYGENARYLIPFQTVVVYAVLRLVALKTAK